MTLIAAGGDRVEDVRVPAEDKGWRSCPGRSLSFPDAPLDLVAQFHDRQRWED